MMGDTELCSNSTCHVYVRVEQHYNGPTYPHYSTVCGFMWLFSRSR